VGQGWIGKNYANDFEQRGLDVVRYGLEEEYKDNKDKIKDCEIVFIAVPTPTTPKGFDYSIVEKSLELVGNGKTAIIKSTILPGTTNTLQEKYPNISVFHSPEFLREIYAAYDAANPSRNIIGVPEMTPENIRRAEEVLKVLPKAKFEKIMLAKEAELVKYIGNCFLYEKVVFFNQMYDLANSLGLDYQNIRDAVTKDERIGESHTAVVHASGHDAKMLGRGAGGHCFIKDFEALIEMYQKNLPKDVFGLEALQALRDKNNSLLVKSQKDLELLKGVVGDIAKYE
jgi:UDPglucose 6-dehydrogenase